MKTSNPMPQEAASEPAPVSWESKWVCADATFDLAYERTNAALRRWIDGMEKALIAPDGQRRRGLPSIS